ncbi:TonB-dependent receptor family protein [Solimonas marina]|uniref:TonB-dependent receptor n=1 Tax=Solimonas marina TaxID=2714601 RepID=A0A970B7T3_9GAMM|nr:TonB-dependent receptor [Solimonas marina]NKF20736.1 TonB-dependent receptor [Solimonas marina]
MFRSSRLLPAGALLPVGLLMLTHSPLLLAAGSDPSAADARRAELLRERATIDAELQRLDAAQATAPAVATPVAANPPVSIDTVVVTGRQAKTPVAQTATTVGYAKFKDQPGLSIAEALALSPGVSFVQGNGPRDVALSVRGSSNRQTYGVRNIQVLEDGFDVTQPDGLSRTDLTDPHAYGAIDVIRGPSSAWYGNYASGGVVDFHLRDGGDIRGVEAGLDTGSFGYLNAYMLAGDRGEHYDYTAFISNVRGQAYTDHTAYLTTTANVLASFDMTPRDRVTIKLIDNELDADLALRLSLNQYRANPYQHGCAVGDADCATVSLLNNGYNSDDGSTVMTPAAAGLSRHDRRTIVGARWEHAFDAQTRIRSQFVFDNRDIKQPTSSASYDGTYPSFNLRSDVFHDGLLFGRASQFAFGGYYNYEEINSYVYNVTPARHAAKGGVTQTSPGHHLNAGLHTREQWQMADAWTVVAALGGEYTELEGYSDQYSYPSGATPTMSRIDAHREFFNVAPELALRYAPAEAWLLHARIAAGYGTPQVSNLFVNADGDAGNNTQLDSQRNVGVDIGAAWHLGDVVRVDLTGFYEFFRDELVSQSAGVGKQSYTFNAPRSEHRGVELGVGFKPLPQALPGAQFSLAYTYDNQIYKRYDEVISTSSDSEVFDRGGNRIPGVQPQTLNARLAYDQPSGALQGLGAYVEVYARDAFYLDNANLLKVPGYGIVNLNLHYDAPHVGTGTRISAYFAVQNLLDQTYIGSASNLSDKLDSTAASLAASSGSIYAGNPRSYFGGVRVQF